MLCPGSDLWKLSDITPRPESFGANTGQDCDACLCRGRVLAGRGDVFVHLQRHGIQLGGVVDDDVSNVTRIGADDGRCCAGGGGGGGGQQSSKLMEVGEHFEHVSACESGVILVLPTG